MIAWIPAVPGTASDGPVNWPARPRTRKRKSAARSPGSMRRLRICRVARGRSGWAVTPGGTNGAGAGFGDGPAVQALPRRRAAEMEEIGGGHGRRLGVRELPPGRVGGTFRRAAGSGCSSRYRAAAPGSMFELFGQPFDRAAAGSGVAEGAPRGQQVWVLLVQLGLEPAECALAVDGPGQCLRAARSSYQTQDGSGPMPIRSSSSRSTGSWPSVPVPEVQNAISPVPGLISHRRS